MDKQQVIAALSALAQSSRLDVFRALVVAGPKGLTPGTLADELGLPPNTLSFHLKELTHAGLISQERFGRNLIYRGRFEQMNALLAFLTENCCSGESCRPPQPSSCKA